jgi:2Fe-2S ferredoxin
MPRVTILPAGLVIEIADGTSLFDAGAKLAAGIETACVGKGTCGLCRVKVISGTEHLVAFTDEERKHLGNVYHLTKVRLACRTTVTGGDVTIELAPKRKPAPR